MTKTDDQAVEPPEATVRVYVSSARSPKKLTKVDRLAMCFLALIDTMQDELDVPADCCAALREQVHGVLNGR